MKQNMGTLDRTLRLLVAALVAALYYTGILKGTTVIILGVLAIVFAATALVRFCPLYLPFGINTCKTKK